MLIKGVNGHKCLEGVMANSRWGETKISFPNGVIIVVPSTGLRKKDGSFKVEWQKRLKSYLTIDDAVWIEEQGGSVQIKTVKKAA